jgi:hypothetical protein
LQNILFQYFPKESDIEDQFDINSNMYAGLIFNKPVDDTVSILVYYLFYVSDELVLAAA